jgi:hypothetical protein
MFKLTFFYQEMIFFLIQIEYFTNLSSPFDWSLPHFIRKLYQYNFKVI